MKFKRLTIILATAFAILVIGAAYITSQGAPTIGGQILWIPQSYLWDTPPPNPWIARIGLSQGYAPNDINQSTLLLEGLYRPSGASYTFENGTKLFVPFAGTDVVNAIASKLSFHFGTLLPGSYHVTLTITGNLNYAKHTNGQAFSVKGSLNVTVDPLPPP